MKPLVIYHGNCADGFTSAWLANMYFQERAGANRDELVVDLHPGVYGKPAPDVTGRRVFMLDFSYPPAVLDRMAGQASEIILIDHHISNIKALEGREWPNVHQHLDDRRCGAWLTSRYFWPEREPNRMVELVDDRDRWVFQYPITRPFHASLFSRPYLIGEWNKLNATVPEAIMEGKAIERKHMKDIHELLEVCARWANIGGHLVPCANLPYTLASDACHLLLEKHRSAPFAACYYVRADGMNVFSLRSREDEFDVSELAKQYDGGGHKTAAGMATQDWPARALP